MRLFINKKNLFLQKKENMRLKIFTLLIIFVVSFNTQQTFSQNINISASQINSIDFDDYYNPDLTLNVTFEKDEKKSALIIENNLFQIGKRWEERLKELFPNNQYTLVMYFDSENSDWFLDFYNGKRKIEESKDSKRFKGIHYFAQ